MDHDKDDDEHGAEEKYQEEREHVEHYSPAHYAVAYGNRYVSLAHVPGHPRGYGELHPGYGIASPYGEEYAHHREAAYAAVQFAEHYGHPPQYPHHLVHHPAAGHPHQVLHHHGHVIVDQTEENEQHEAEIEHEGVHADQQEDIDDRSVEEQVVEDSTNYKDNTPSANANVTDEVNESIEPPVEGSRLVEEIPASHPDHSEQTNDAMQVETKASEGNQDVDSENERSKENIPNTSHNPNNNNRPNHQQEYDSDDERHLTSIDIDEKMADPVAIAQNELIEQSTPTTELEKALYAALQRKEAHANRLANEILKLLQFIRKRKQTYKRKRKNDGAPTRALSAYNIYIQDSFARLAKENKEALTSEDADAQLKRVPPANLVAATGSKWKVLSAEEKAKYEERARKDKARYHEQMAEYHAPDKPNNRKRSKTGYNMFFSAHVLRMKQSEGGVPSERGSVARIVGTAWKGLSAEEKSYYEREADKYNGMNPGKDGGDDDDEDDDGIVKTQPGEQLYLHGGPDPHAPHLQAMQLPHPSHDPRHHPPYYPHHHLYVPPPPAAYGHYDYSQHHQRHHQARAQGYQQVYPPLARHPYE